MSSSRTSARGRLASPEIIVEIGNDWLKLVHAVPHRGGVALARVCLQKLESGDVLSPQVVADAVARLKLPRMPVIACLPRQAVNIRTLELPSTDPAEIADMVDLQVGKQTPYSKDEIVSDYRLVASRREGYSRVVLAIVQRSVLRQRYHLLEEAGLDVKSMSVSSEGVLNWVRGAGPSSGVAAVLDLDSYYADFSVVGDGELLFTRSILVGANDLLADYPRWREKIAEEVRRSFEIFDGEMPGVAVERVVVTGAGPRVDGLPAYLGERLGMPAEGSDSLACIARLPEEPDVRSGAYRPVSLTALVGIALAPGALQFNLVPDSLRLRKGLELKARYLAGFGILVMAALLSASLLANLRIFLLRDRLRQVQDELRDTGPAAAQVADMQKLVRLVAERQDPRLAAVSLLQEVHRRVPPNLLLDSLEISMSKNQIALGGTAGQRRDISQLIKNLEASEILKDVHEGGSTAMDSKTRKYRFQIVCALEREP
jgi:Tfp pilus assembly PilM family ATPase/Tfp pilus assembly protein PilN